MEVFPVLYTTRLELRRITVEDIPSLLKYANNSKIADHVLNIPHPYREPDAVFRISYVVQGFKNRERYVFSIISRESLELIGEISLHLDKPKKLAQLAYWVGEPFWGRGIASEATEAVLKFGMTIPGLDLIFAECHIENKGSEKVMLKNGMIKCGNNGNIIQYKVTKEMFEKQQSHSPG